MRRFFVENIDETKFLLPEEESKHIVKVLRMSVGDEIELVNGNGVLCIAKIEVAHPKKCEVIITQRIVSEDLQPSFHLAIAPTKNLDRIEWLVEKATELGLGRISFLTCRNNERKQLKTDRIKKIAISAMKQSKSLYLPVIEELEDFDDFLGRYPKGYIAHCYSSKKENFFDAISDHSLPVLIGPEGDFTEVEVEKAEKIGYISVSLGKTRLRTETAGLYACALMKLKTE